MIEYSNGHAQLLWQDGSAVLLCCCSLQWDVDGGRVGRATGGRCHLFCGTRYGRAIAAQGPLRKLALPTVVLRLLGSRARRIAAGSSPCSHIAGNDFWPVGGRVLAPLPQQYLGHDAQAKRALNHEDIA